MRGILLTKYNLKKLSCIDFHAYVSTQPAFVFCVFTEMSDEQPVAVVRKRKAEAVCCNQLACIVHYAQHKQHTTEEVRPLSDAQFQSICYARDTRRDQISDSVRLDRICENIP